MKLRFMSVAMIAMLLIAAVTPATFADSIASRRSSLSEVSGGGPPPNAWASSFASRQVSGLPWSRVWTQRNIFRNRGR